MSSVKDIIVLIFQYTYKNYCHVIEMLKTKAISSVILGFIFFFYQCLWVQWKFLFTKICSNSRFS